MGREPVRSLANAGFRGLSGATPAGSGESRTVDITRLMKDVDLRRVVEEDLGQPHSRGKAWRWRCPFHTEQHGHSLAVWQNGWRCLGKCQRGGDALSWVMHYRRLSYQDAVQVLEPALASSPGPSPRPARRERPASPAPAPDYRPSPADEPDRDWRALAAAAAHPAEPPREAWQDLAVKIVDQAQDWLWGPSGEAALAFLRNECGLYVDTIREARIGYVPGEPDGWRALYGLSVPCGITLPWFAGGDLWGVRVRRLGNSAEYTEVAGGNVPGAMYWADNLLAGWPIFAADSEFDCLVAWQEGMDLVCPVAPGAAETLLNVRWSEAIGAGGALYTLAGSALAAEKLMARLRALPLCAERLRLPEGKDLTGFFRRAGTNALRDWLKGVVATG